jgi:alkylation response protein AidB-like acyl-CoA dehydrogenase
VAHRVAEMQSAIEQARSITLQAYASLDSGPVPRSLAVSAAKTLVGEAGRFVGEQAVQLHGGIGMTDALHVGRFFKRLMAIDMTWGSADHHVARYGKAMSGTEVYWSFDEHAKTATPVEPRVDGARS